MCGLYVNPQLFKTILNMIFITTPHIKGHQPPHKGILLVTSANLMDYYGVAAIKNLISIT